MQMKVDISAEALAAAMEADPDFGAEVLTNFLDRVKRHPKDFAGAAMFRQCRIKTANNLRNLAAAIQSS